VLKRQTVGWPNEVHGVATSRVATWRAARAASTRECLERSACKLIGVLVACGLSISMMCPRLAWGQEERKARVGAGAGAGVNSYQFGGLGPLLEARGVASMPLGETWYLNAVLTLVYARNANDKRLDYDADGVDDLNTDERTLVALFPRATLGVRLSRAFALELGGFLGVAHTTLVSTKCGESSHTGAGYGISAGPALALGERRQLGIALHGEFMWAPYERCTNSSSASFEAGLPVSPHRHLQDDAQLGLVLRAHYLF
jgi:hypothetical protein